MRMISGSPGNFPPQNGPQTLNPKPICDMMHTCSMEAADGVVAGTADDASFRHVLEEPAEVMLLPDSEESGWGGV